MAIRKRSRRLFRRADRRNVKPVRQPVLEHLEARQLLAGDGVIGDLDEPIGTVQGFKWHDDNSNGVIDRGEPGLAGLTIYADLNRNGEFEPEEPWTITQRDNPQTRVDETGHYELIIPHGGEVIIREVVPDGFVQTFPLDFPHLPDEGPNGDGPNGDGDEQLAEMHPAHIHLELADGEEAIHPVEVIIHPFCIVPVEIDIVSQDPDIDVKNVSGVQLNGCGGDVSRFEILFGGDGQAHEFALVAIDANSGHELDFTTVHVDVPGGGHGEPGGHLIIVETGQVVEGIDFGNHRIDPPQTSNIEGRKWFDSNGNGARDNGERGLGGVTIYLDLNDNGRQDRGEPMTETRYDDPWTDFDEAGFYSFNVRPGEYAVREVVPRGFKQTFPGPSSSVISTEIGRYDRGVAIGLDVSGVEWKTSDDGATNTAINVTVTWPDTCGEIDSGATSHVVIGDHILVGLHGMQVGDACAEVISPETQTILVTGMEPGSYTVVASLRESVPWAEDPVVGVTTLGAVGEIVLGASGVHRVIVEAGDVVEAGFGNRNVAPQGIIQGVKWNDLNGDAQRQDDEPGLPGVTIFADLNLNGEFDRGEPLAITQRDDPDTRQDETGQYSLLVPPGDILVMEIVPRGYKQIHPSPFRRVAFPFNLGHVVNVLRDGQVDKVDFGNQRDETQRLGSIEGTKWIDFNANGIREDDEPAEPGVTIYLDANHNGTLDRGERTAITQRDDPDTDFDETGRYQFTELLAGQYFVREDLPFGFAQSFPTFGISIDAESQPLSSGHALSYELAGANLFVGDDGQLGVDFALDVTWPNGCGSIIDSDTEVTFDGQFIRIASTGVQFDGFCTQAISTETQSITMERIVPGDYGLSAVLMEVLPDGDLIESFLVEGRFVVRGEDAHLITLQSGDHLSGFDFGDFPTPSPPAAEFDFNDDGTVDTLDLDALAAAMRGTDASRQYDLTQDGSVDQADMDHLVENVLNTVYGDSNLDGVFSSSDLVKVFQASEYEDGTGGNSTWAEGDWDGDGEFTTSDLVFVFQKGTYSHTATRIEASIADRIWSIDLDRKHAQV